MNQAVGDQAAITFAVAFYDALAAGKPVEFAYELGCAALQLAGISEHLTPVLKKRIQKPVATVSSQVDFSEFTVFLAEVTDDLYAHRQMVADYLAQYHVRVIPLSFR